MASRDFVRSKVREREWRRESPIARTDLNESSENGETNAEMRPVGSEAGREAGSVRGVRGGPEGSWLGYETTHDRTQFRGLSLSSPRAIPGQTVRHEYIY
jgi:hypothetical protein